MNLIPDVPGKNPNAWCTWGTQNYTVTDKMREQAKQQFIGDQGGAHAGRDNLNEEVLFRENGWAYGWESIRSDLYFLMDDGWDFPYRCANPLKNSAGCELNLQRFPSFTGKPAERLKKLNDKLKDIGWRGLGLWTAAQIQGEDGNHTTYPMGRVRRYWKERLQWFSDAGIEYLKMDWGARSLSLEFRKMITELGWEYAPDLLIEHAIPRAPLNDLHLGNDGSLSGSGSIGSETEYLNALKTLLEFSDLTRTYDVLNPFGLATTLDRTAYCLKHARIGGVVNIEDPVYVAAGLGCAFAVMRSPKWTNLRVGKVGNRAKCFKEVERAANWQRIAPVFPAAQDEKIFLSEQRLTDEWLFTPGTTWAESYVNKKLHQTAPATIARNMDLPEVSCRTDSERPFIVCSKHPNSSIAVAALPRMSIEQEIFKPKVGITLHEDIAGKKIGVFGFFESMTMDCGNANARIFAQDLAGMEAHDITGSVLLENGKLTVPGTLLDTIAQNTSDSGDDPGIVLSALE